MPTVLAAAVAITLEAMPAAGFDLQGRVLDPTGAAIAGASVTAVPDAGAARPSAVTDGQGGFRLALGAGGYTIRIVAAGFVEQSLALTARDTGVDSREFVLSVAGFQETVAVSAPPPGDEVQSIRSATRTLTPLRDVPQSVTVATAQLIKDQLMTSMADVVRYLPGVGTHQGENNRDQVVIRGNNSSADFFLDGVRDDVQYYRDLYNLERVEALKGPNAMVFGRGGGGGVINRVTKEAGFQPIHEVTLQGGSYGRKRLAVGCRSAPDGPARLPSQRHVRELGQLPGPGDSRPLRPQSDPHRRAERADADHAGLRAPARCPRGRSRHPLVPGEAGRRRRRDLLRRSR
jgi:TonB-dependent Receptor Plug Domain/Carboxypeptidase regulatory-like domain